LIQAVKIWKRGEKAALKSEPQAVMAMVNSSIANAQIGENAKAEESCKPAPRGLSLISHVASWHTI
jgi:hypothetical protein